MLTMDEVQARTESVTYTTIASTLGRLTVVAVGESDSRLLLPSPLASA